MPHCFGRLAFSSLPLRSLVTATCNFSGTKESNGEVKSGPRRSLTRQRGSGHFLFADLLRGHPPAPAFGGRAGGRASTNGRRHVHADIRLRIQRTCCQAMANKQHLDDIITHRHTHTQRGRVLPVDDDGVRGRLVPIAATFFVAAAAEEGRQAHVNVGRERKS